MISDKPDNPRTDFFVQKAQGAFLGAAIGDALGWPQEDRSRKAGGTSTRQSTLFTQGFQDWLRISGGRFFAHEELIRAGEYSDDTQLLLCTARSLLRGPSWWKSLMKSELPMWTLYERGGGGATKRAVEALLLGREPWMQPRQEQVRQYFDAGGNGIAMRILPHCILRHDDDTFEASARAIMADGICTHGHPRALIGALAYGYAIWTALRETKTLEYGSMIHRLLSETDLWSSLPDIGDIAPTWIIAANRMPGDSYSDRWQNAVMEIRQLLVICGEAMRLGALSLDRETLERIGCFDRKVSGAGTIAAAAAVFLASRYAADPFHGIIEAAFALGADTDTIASMTGGLLGAISGTEWLGAHAEQIQDSRYIRELAGKLANHSAEPSLMSAIKSVSKSDVESTIRALHSADTGDSFCLPDGRAGTVAAKHQHVSRSNSTLAVSWKVGVDDGQTLYIKRLSRISVKESRPDRPNSTVRACEITKIAMKLPVGDMAKSVHFYSEVLGLAITKESKNYVTLGGVISLVGADHLRTLSLQTGLPLTQLRSFVHLRCKSIDALYRNVSSARIRLVTQLMPSNGNRLFRCLDPDGNIVEIYEEPNDGRSQEAGK